MRSSLRHALACALLLLAGACASFGPRIAPPTVTVNDVRLDRIEGTSAWFVAAVTLDNPNDRELAVAALDATLTIEGEAVATAALAAPVTLPARGTAPAEIAAQTGVDAILRAVVRNQAVVPVTPEARGAHLMSRFTPRALRAIARLEPPL